MSRSMRLSASPRQRWANILAVCFGVTCTTLSSGFAFGQICAEIIGPVYVGQPARIYADAGGWETLGAKLIGYKFVPTSSEILWGDGTSSGASISGPYPESCAFHYACHVYTASGEHVYSAPMTGIHATVQTTQNKIAATGGVVGVNVESCNTANFDVVAAPPPPPPDVLSNPRVKIKLARVGHPVTGIVATFSDSNTNPDASFYTALIDWGDGTQTAGIVSSTAGASSGTLSVSAPQGGHTYTHSGAERVSVTITEVTPGTASDMATGWVELF